VAVLVCMDAHIASSDTAARAQKLHESGLIIVPIICPGYSITDYGKWYGSPSL